MRSESVGGVERFVAVSLRHLSSSRDKNLSQRLPISVNLARDLVLEIAWPPSLESGTPRRGCPGMVGGEYFRGRPGFLRCCT
jgi:hypothetical protein